MGACGCTGRSSDDVPGHLDQKAAEQQSRKPNIPPAYSSRSGVANAALIPADSFIYHSEIYTCRSSSRDGSDTYNLQLSTGLQPPQDETEARVQAHECLVGIYQMCVYMALAEVQQQCGPLDATEHKCQRTDSTCDGVGLAIGNIDSSNHGGIDACEKSVKPLCESMCKRVVSSKTPDPDAVEKKVLGSLDKYKNTQRLISTSSSCSRASSSKSSSNESNSVTVDDMVRKLMPPIVIKRPTPLECPH